MFEIRTTIKIVFLIMVLSTNACTDNSSTEDQTSIELHTYANMDSFYVVNAGSDSISLLDAVTGVEQTTFKLSAASYPHHANVSPDGRTLIVSAPGIDMRSVYGRDIENMKGNLLKINATSGAIMTEKTLGGITHTAAFSPDGKEIWATLMNRPGSLLILDSVNLETMQEIAVGNMPANVTFSFDGKYAFVANSFSNSISVIDVSTKLLVKDLDVGTRPVGVWPGSDNIMYVGNEEGRSIAAIDSSTLTVIRNYDLGFMPGMAALAPNGELWVTDADAGQVVYFTSGSTALTGDIRTGKGAHAIAFSDDGSIASVTNEDEDTVTMIDVASHSIVKTVKVGVKPNDILFRRRIPKPMKI